jgi:hypothetical protein
MCMVDRTDTHACRVVQLAPLVGHRGRAGRLVMHVGLHALLALLRHRMPSPILAICTYGALILVHIVPFWIHY